MEYKIEVPADWFKGLIKYAKAVDDDRMNLRELDRSLPALLGYIDSANFILKEKE